MADAATGRRRRQDRAKVSQAISEGTLPANLRGGVVMTAFSDGMKKAGIDTDAAELYVAGAEALSKYKTEAKALPLLVAFVLKNRGALNALCREKLASIAVDMAAKIGSGQMATVQKAHFGSAAPASEPMPGAGPRGVARRGREINADARQPLASREGQSPNGR